MANWRGDIDYDMAASSRPRSACPECGAVYGTLHVSDCPILRGGLVTQHRDPNPLKKRASVLQPWVETLPYMQQSVLLAAIRGPDGMRKRHPAKELIKWYRRCVLLSAFDGRALTDPYEAGGGSFTGPIKDNDEPNGGLRKAVDDFIDARDEMTLHYYGHAMHAFQIVGAKHPSLSTMNFWWGVYERMANALHLHIETPREMDRRLGDNESQWRERNDPSSTCSD